MIAAAAACSLSEDPPVTPPAADPPFAVRLAGVTKRYGARTVLEGVSFDVQPGITGLVGPNGAGKSTLVRAILGLVRLAGGSVRVFSLDPAVEPSRVRRLIGVVPEDDASVPGLAGVEMVQYAARLSGLPATEALRRAHEVLDWCDAGQERYRAVETLSVGMRQKVAFAAALVHDPALVILDEPTNGLDPQGTREVRNLIRSLADEGITIFLSSHLLSEIEQLSSHVAVMSQGRLVANGSLDELRSHANTRLVVDVDDPERAVPILTEQGLEPLTRRETTFTAPVGPDCDAAAITRALVSGGVGVRAIQVERPSLEEYFVTLTGEGFEVAR